MQGLHKRTLWHSFKKKYAKLYGHSNKINRKNI